MPRRIEDAKTKIDPSISATKTKINGSNPKYIKTTRGKIKKALSINSKKKPCSIIIAKKSQPTVPAFIFYLKFVMKEGFHVTPRANSFNSFYNVFKHLLFYS